MADDFQTRYQKLNPNQKLAVDSLEGPVLVVAGPGSGKTEIISLRVANILTQTDAEPNNILCLTYTEAAARNMRKRLIELIGETAYRVKILTFHGFGSEIINLYSEYFFQEASFKSASDLNRYEIIQNVLENASFDNPLKQARHPEIGFIHLKDILEAIQNLKKNGLSPTDFMKILKHNEQVLSALAEPIQSIFSPRISMKIIPQIGQFLLDLQKLNLPDFPIPNFQPINQRLSESLQEAYLAALKIKKTNPISSWKEQFLVSLPDGKNLKDAKNLKKQLALAEIYQLYQDKLYHDRLFDYDDMLLEVIEAIEKYPALKSSLQENYQYFCVDEFQDTNQAQMRILYLLTDAEVNEGRPNLLVVGDDDQSIYKFQGAEVENILQFQNTFRDSKIITITENYRSSQPILNLAREIILKGENRLERKNPEINKELKAANQSLPVGKISQNTFSTNLHQYHWIAQEIKRLIQNGHPISEIAVLARKHKGLLELMPFLKALDIPIQYQKSQDILQEKHILQLIKLSRFLSSLNQKNQLEADDLLPEILNFPFWTLERKVIWELSIKAAREHRLWLEIMSDESSPDSLKELSELFWQLASDLKNESAPKALDILIEKTPFKEYYFRAQKYQQEPSVYLHFLSGLRVLYQAIEEYKPNHRSTLLDLIYLVDQYQKNNLELKDESSYIVSDQAVQLLTAHGAKGLEFQTVFVIDCNQNIWASSNPGRNLLPTNLPISSQTDDQDDFLRLFYVAITRAKTNLYLTSAQKKEDNQDLFQLSFLEGKPVSIPLNDPFQKLEILETNWQGLADPPIADEENQILAAKIADYRLSPSDLKTYLDISRGGPQVFLERVLLQFPQAKTVASIFGICVHHALRRLDLELKANHKLSDKDTFISWFIEELNQQNLSKQDLKDLKGRGRHDLNIFYDQNISIFNPHDWHEYNLKYQEIQIGETRITGIIDHIGYKPGDTSQDKNLERPELFIYDFKTSSKPIEVWDKGDKFEKINAYFYRQQLLFYKLLLDNSAVFKNKYQINTGSISFITPNEKGYCPTLDLNFSTLELDRLVKLIQIVYAKIKRLEFPEISKYTPDIEGIQKFEADLLNEN
jgi:DNA helicase-2/ATP-dependent DNA helicase PcrA